MKAKIKATGEIVEVTRYSYGITNPKVYSITFLRNGNYERIDNADEFEILSDQPEVPIIDWEQRRYEIAKEAMNGFIVAIFGSEGGIATISKYDNPEEAIAKMTIGVTNELINQLKNTPIK